MRWLIPSVTGLLVALGLATAARAADDQAVCASMSPDYQGRIAACNRQIDSKKLRDKSLAIAYHNRATARAGKGDLSGAYADYTQAIAIHPDYALAYLNRGVTRQGLGDLAGATTDFDQAIRLDPKNGYAAYARGNVRRLRGDLDGAIADYDQAIKLDGTSARAFNNRGVARQAKGDLDGAIADYGQAITLDPHHINAYIGRGTAVQAKGDPTGAIADYDQAIKLDPNAVGAYYNRGIARNAKGDYAGAIADFDQADRLQPDDANNLASRGLAYESKGNTAHARDDFNAALKHANSGSWAYNTAQKHLAALTSSAPPATSQQADTKSQSPVAPPSATSAADTLAKTSDPRPLPKQSNEKRVALVIGNSTYAALRPLSNPGNDARLMAETLRAAGFTLIGGGALLDLNEEKFRRTLKQLGEELQGADVGLFYYAGHGMQLRDINYLVPIDANPSKEEDVELDMLDAEVVVRQMQAAGTGLNIIILDACRSNPFSGRALAFGRGRADPEQRLRDVGAASGLARMQAPIGMLISFSTQPGRVAQDGPDDGNSPFTKALAETIRKPGLSLFDTFNEVSGRVDLATRHTQLPYISLSHITSFYFIPAAGVSATGAGGTPPPR